MKKLNDTPSSPLRFVDEDKVIGQFYNAYDHTYHLAEYTPYAKLPTEYLCGAFGKFSPSREDNEKMYKCPKCKEKMKEW